MSFIDGFSDFTVSTSFQPSSTATQRFLQLHDKSCTSPLLSLPTMLAELRTSLGGCHSLLNLNTTSTIQHKYAARQKQAFAFGYADGSGQGSRRGSHVDEINTWLWNFGRPQPRIGGLAVAKTKRVRRQSSQSRSESSRRAAETRKARKRAVDQIRQTNTWYLPFICTHSVKLAFSRVHLVCPALAFIRTCWC
jgi:hypothetical protein